MSSMMFPKIRQCSVLKPKFTQFYKLYCSDKLKKLQKNRILEDKKTKLLQESANIIAQSYEECAEFEEKVLKQVGIEKEKDAVLRSRLSKECNTLFTTPANKVAGKCPIHLDKITLQSGPDLQNWTTYSFNQLQGAISEKAPLESTSNPKKDETPGPAKHQDNTAYYSGILSNELTISYDGASGGGASDGGAIAATRPIRQEPGKVIFCFIPEEWWRVFIPKTGVTGFGTFMLTFSTFLVSKEYYVLEHYYYHGLSALILWTCSIKYIGPLVAKMLDKELDQFEQAWNEDRVNQKQMLEDSITNELYNQFQMEGQLLLIDAKRENVKLQLEEEFRKRQMMAYTTVKQRLDYHVAVKLAKQRIQQRNLVDYVTKEVKKAITPEMESKLIYYSIDKIVADLDQEKK